MATKRCPECDREISMPERVQQLEDRAEALLDGYRGLRQTFALLQPALPGQRLSQALGTGDGVQGFEAVRTILFFSCVLDIVKLCFDRYKSTPSIERIMQDMGDPTVVDALRVRATHGYSDWDDNWKRERIAQFDGHWRVLRHDWSTVKGRQDMARLRDFRHKHVAHLEMKLHNGRLIPTPIEDFGLTWADPGNAIYAMNPLVDNLNHVVRDSDFDMDGAVQQFDRISDGFWRAFRGPK